MSSSAMTGNRKLEPAEARRTFWFHGWTVPGVSKTPVDSKCLRRTDNRASVAGVLQPGQNYQQGIFRSQQSIEGPLRRFNQCRHALRSFGGASVVERIGGDDEGQRISQRTPVFLCCLIFAEK